MLLSERTLKNRKSPRSFVLFIPRHSISGKSTEQKKANKMLKAIKKTSKSFIPYSVLHAQNVILSMSKAFFLKSLTSEALNLI